MPTAVLPPAVTLRAECRESPRAAPSMHGHLAAQTLAGGRGLEPVGSPAHSGPAIPSPGTAAVQFLHLRAAGKGREGLCACTDWQSRSGAGAGRLSHPRRDAQVGHAWCWRLHFEEHFQLLCLRIRKRQCCTNGLCGVRLGCSLGSAQLGRVCATARGHTATAACPLPLLTSSRAASPGARTTGKVETQAGKEQIHGQHHRAERRLPSWSTQRQSDSPPWSGTSPRTHDSPSCPSFFLC